MKINPADKVERWPIEKLVPYARNARTHSPEQVAQIAASIREWGWTVPLLVDTEGGIIAGHGRLMAAQRLSMTQVPVMVADGWTDAQKRAYVLADNKLTLNGGWDNELLGLELAELQDLGADLSLIGFSDEELTDLFAEKEAGDQEGLTDEDEIPEVQAEPVSVTGDVWQLGAHRVMCGDATNYDEIKILCAGDRVDMCFTSPPYNLGDNAKLRGFNGSGKSTVYNGRVDHKSEEEYIDFLVRFTDVALSVADTVFVNIQCLAGNKFCIPEYWHRNADKLIDIMIWDKVHAPPQMAERVLNSVWEFVFIFGNVARPTRSMKHGGNFRGTIDNIFRLNPVGKKDKLAIGHGAVFPVEFASHFISSFSDRCVLDSFGGSGTTLIAAEKNGRVARLMEIDPIYCDVIIKRWQNFTGKSAVNEKTGKSFDEST